MKPTRAIKRRRAQLAATFTLAAEYIVTKQNYFACVALSSACENCNILAQVHHGFARFFCPPLPKRQGRIGWWPEYNHLDRASRARHYIKAQNARAFGLLLMAELARSGALD